MCKWKNKILKLRQQGKSYRQICALLGCSKGTVAYHLGDGQKAKADIRKKQFRKNNPFGRKLEAFLSREQAILKNRNHRHGWKKLLKLKFQTFQRKNKMNSEKITIKDVVDKFGENPRCYISGELIDIYKPRTYHFDHIIPISRGGDCSLSNLGICTRKANQSKTDMTPDEFYAFCKQVIQYQESCTVKI